MIKPWIGVLLCLAQFGFLSWVLTLHPERHGFPVTTAIFALSRWLYLGAGIFLAIMILAGQVD